MRTVKSMIEELRKFPDDAMCYAYSGEFEGLVVKDPTPDVHPFGERAVYRRRTIGVIFCGESSNDKPLEERETEIFGQSTDRP